MMTLQAARKEIIPGTLILTPLETEDAFWCPGIVTGVVYKGLVQYRYFERSLSIPPTGPEAIEIATTFPIIGTFFSGYLGFTYGSWQKIGSLPDFQADRWFVQYMYNSFMDSVVNVNTFSRRPATEAERTLPEHGVSGHSVIEFRLAKALGFNPIPAPFKSPFEDGKTSFYFENAPSQEDAVRIVRLIGEHLPSSEPLIDLYGGSLSCNDPSELRSIARILKKNGIKGRIF
jgi:hypothetical protein